MYLTFACFLNLFLLCGWTIWIVLAPLSYSAYAFEMIIPTSVPYFCTFFFNLFLLCRQNIWTVIIWISADIYHTIKMLLLYFYVCFCCTSTCLFLLCRWTIWIVLALFAIVWISTDIYQFAAEDPALPAEV